MTYIKIDSNFIELESLATILRLPQNVVEEIVDRGYMYGSEPSLLTEDLSNIVRKMRLAAFLSGVELNEEQRSSLLDQHSSMAKFRHTVLQLYREKKINKQQLSKLSSWSSGH